MQPPLTYSWIALTASAPVILLLTTWSLAVFHCRRRQWTPMDVFLVSILSQSVVQQFLGFIYSTIVLLKLSSISTGDAVCTGMMWFFITIPIFKGATITSLAVDRWLFHSRFSYRLSVRKNHIRYHVAVLAVLSCTVGFTGLITFNNPELLTSTTTHHPFGSSQYSFDQCTFLPFKFDLKFVIFYASAHLLIILVGLIALCKSSCNKNNDINGQQQQKNLYKRRRRRSLPLDLTPTLSNASTASSSISNTSPSAFFSTPGLSAKAVLSNPPNNAYHLRNKMLLDFKDQSKKEEKKFYRLSTSVGLLILSILCTHIPFVIATLLSRYEILVPIQVGTNDTQLNILNWPVTNIILWFQVFEGLAILLILLIVDNTVPGWLFHKSKKGNRKSAKLSEHIQNPSNIRNAEFKGHKTQHSQPINSVALNNRMNLKAQAHYTNGGFTADYKSNRFPITNGSLFAGLAPPTSCGVSSPNSTSQPDQQRRLPKDSFHQVLERSARANGPRTSTDMDSFTSFRRAFPEDESEYDKKSYHHRYASVGSVTTVANDDFEFHHSRPFHPKLQYSTGDDYNQSTYVLPKSQPPIPSKRMEKENNSKKFKPKDFDTSSTAALDIVNQAVTQAPTSLSMNDLDLLDDLEYKYCVSSAKPIVGTQEYPQKRIYRKRGRMQGPNISRDIVRRNNKTLEQSSTDLPRRRVLSMECLSPQTLQTDYRNFLDISYLDTGEILVRKTDSNKCIFVTDFI